MQKPDVDHIDGLSPAISIEQKTTSKNPRSTVGTVTEIYDYLRLLFARVGVPYSPATGLPIESQTVTQMVDRVLALPEGTRLYLLAPIVRGRKGEYRKELAELQKKGFQRVKVDGTVLRDRRRARARQEVQARHRRGGRPPGRASSATSATGWPIRSRRRWGWPTGMAIAEFADKPLPTADTGGERRTSRRTRRTSASPSRRASPARSRASPSTRSSRGCSRSTTRRRLPQMRRPRHRAAVRGRPDRARPSAEPASRAPSVPWAKTGSTSPYYLQTLEALAKQFKVSMTTPWEKLPKKVRDVILHGSGEEEVEFVYEDGVRTYKTTKPFEGVIGNIERRWRETESDWVREELSRYQSAHPCDACGGYRLKPQALAVKVGGLHIGQVAEMSIRAANDWFAELPAKLKKKQTRSPPRILKEIRDRLQFLVDVGLDYLTLSRASGTLSGGESQRIRLASQIGSGLTGVLYVLDEPSIGLHQRDNERLLETLKHLRDIGNTVIVVEHDEDAIRRGRPRGRHRPRRRRPRRPCRGAGHARPRSWPIADS